MKKIAVQIFTDSTCDLALEDRARLGVTVIPLSVQFAEESFLDGEEIKGDPFYDRLEQSAQLPTTSMIPPDTFQKAFEQAVSAGDEVVGLFLSSEISGTYHAACMAKESFPEGMVHVVDSRSACLSLALLVAEAVKFRDEGFSGLEIVEKLAPLIKRVRLVAAVNTLKYLRKGGRISATSAVVGEMLSIKPVISIIDGSIQSIGKARGMPAAMKQMLQEAANHVPDLDHTVVLGHAGAPELLQKAIELVKEPLKLQTWLSCEVGAVIGTYTGRGCVGIAYIAQEHGSKPV